MTGSDAPRILIVDDDSDVAETYRLWLEEEFDVSVAVGGSEALDRLDGSIDVVLLDRRMPGLSGDEVLGRIREHDLGCRVAMVTAVEPDFDILEMGFDAYLSKPVESDHLTETVRTLLERSTYETLLQEYYALIEKQATLETTKTRDELATSEEYQRLQDEIDALRNDLAGTLNGVADDEDFVSTIRNIE